MPRRDRKYVLQLLGDLVGVHVPGRRRPTEAAEGDPPAGVAARLAVLWAVGRDPALLTSAAGSVTPAAREARRQLLKEAVERGGEVDVLAELTLRVRCGRAKHSVRLSCDGTVQALAHRDLDVDAERVAASLGGELLPCLRAVDEADLYWSPPVADDGPRLVPIEAGELFAFVRLLRGWAAEGHSLSSCAAAVDLGVERAEVAGHLALGMDVPAAVEWRDVTPKAAVRWAAIGFTRADAAMWIEQRRSLKQAELATAVAGDTRWLARWARVTGRGPSTPALAEWAQFGAPVGVWGEAASRGLRATEVPGWLGAGFQPVEVLRYAHLRVPLDEAVQWRDAGFTAYVATGCLGVGMTLHDACALRGLPAKQVQELWRSCGSAEAVRDALAS